MRRRSCLGVIGGQSALKKQQAIEHEKRRKWFEIVAIRCHDVTQWIMGKYPRPSWDDGQNCAEGSQPSQ